MKLLLAFLFVGILRLHAMDYHVSPVGDDTGKGSADAPFRTIARAADGDPMTPDGAPIAGGGTDHLLGEKLPLHLTANNLRGAVLWAIPGKAWSSWTRIISDYDPAKGRIGFADFKGNWWLEEIHNPSSKEGTFYLAGARALLDAPGEWFFDESDGFVYLIPPDPSQPPSEIEIQTRRNGIDLKSLSHIRVEGLSLVGCSADLDKAEFCTLSRIRGRHLFMTRGGRRSGVKVDSQTS